MKKDWPEGALQDRTGLPPQTPVYFVNARDGDISKNKIVDIWRVWLVHPFERKQSLDHNKVSNKMLLSFVFDNYFHALAYSLKVKANLKEKDNA